MLRFFGLVFALVLGAHSRLLEDKEGFVLYTVVILKKYVESFRNDARSKKFPVRDFTYVPEHAGSGLSKIEKLELDLQETLVGAMALCMRRVRWCPSCIRCRTLFANRLQFVFPKKNLCCCCCCCCVACHRFTCRTSVLGSSVTSSLCGCT